METVASAPTIETQADAYLDQLSSLNNPAGLKDPKVLDYLNSVRPDPENRQRQEFYLAVQTGLLERIIGLDPAKHPDINPHQAKELRFYLEVAKYWEMGKIHKNIDAYLKTIRLPKPPKQPGSFSRRDFVKGAAAGLAGSFLAPKAINALSTSLEKPAAEAATQGITPPSPTSRPEATSTLPPQVAKPTATTPPEIRPGSAPTQPAKQPEKPQSAKLVEKELLSPGIPQGAATERPRLAPEKAERILYPAELSYKEVKEWIGKMRNSHDAVITESLFTKELAAMPLTKRQQVLKAIAEAHAEGLIKHYGDTEAIIGLNPGHGGSDIGSSGQTPEGGTLYEKSLTWELAQLTAQEITSKTQGKYIVIMLRPKEPVDEDLDKDGIISPVERLQKRKALLLNMEKNLRTDPKERGQNIVYLSLHFNGSTNPNEKGIETFWPNPLGTSNGTYRESSRKLAVLLHQTIRDRIKSAGYQVLDRGAKEDPDMRLPRSNSDQVYGPYNDLGSPKLDRNLST